MGKLPSSTTAAPLTSKSSIYAMEKDILPAQYHFELEHALHYSTPYTPRPQDT